MSVSAFFEVPTSPIMSDLTDKTVSDVVYIGHVGLWFVPLKSDLSGYKHLSDMSNRKDDFQLTESLVYN